MLLNYGVSFRQLSDCRRDGFGCYPAAFLWRHGFAYSVRRGRDDYIRLISECFGMGAVKFPEFIGRDLKLLFSVLVIDDVLGAAACQTQLFQALFELCVPEAF